MNLFKNKIVLFVATLLFSNAAFCHGVVTGYVKEVRVENNGNVLVIFDRDAGGTPPECSATTKNNMAFNVTEPGGEGMLSVALAAQASGNLLRGRGSGRCSNWSTIETAVYVVMITETPN